jgi:hypothetical protein
VETLVLFYRARVQRQPQKTFIISPAGLLLVPRGTNSNTAGEAFHTGKYSRILEEDADVIVLANNYWTNWSSEASKVVYLPLEGGARAP